MLALNGLAVAAASQADPPIPPDPALEPGFVHTVLENGLTVSILTDPRMPVVATQHWVRVGGAHEEPDQRGFAHLFEHMMFSATETRARGEYARFHTRVGGAHNGTTYHDRTVYHSVVAPEHHDTVLQMEAERLHALVLDPEQMALDRKVVTEELRLREATPTSRLKVQLMLDTLGDHPYARGPLGTADDIAARTIDDAQAFYDAYYRPDFIHLVVVGPVDRERTVERIAELYGPLHPSGATRPEVPALLTLELPEYVEVTERIPPLKVTAVGYALPPLTHPDAAAVRMMVQMLGGDADPFREALVTRRHQALEASTTSRSYREGGLLSFLSASLPTRRKARAFALIDETIDELSRLDWNSEAALDAARRTALRQEQFGTFSAQHMATRIGYAEWMLGDVDLAFDGIEQLEALTTDDIGRVWQTYVAEATPIRTYLHRGTGGTP